MNNISCKECGSKNVAQGIEIIKRDTGYSQAIHAEIETYPDAWLRLNKGVIQKRLYTNICADCGAVDVRLPVKDAKEIWEAYQKRENNLK